MEQPYVDTTNVGGNEYKIRDTEIRKILTPEYNTENSYTLDDLVMYEGKLYVCIEENQGIWNDTQWQEITLSEYLDFVNEKYLGLTKKLVQAIGVLENLQTAFKENLVGAINENKKKIEVVSTDLASKIGRTYTGSLNDLRTPGLYWCTMSDVTQRPVDSAGSVEVVTDNGSYVTQVYTALGNNQYIRGRNGATGNWSEWTHLASRDYVREQAKNAISSVVGDELSYFEFQHFEHMIFDVAESDTIFSMVRDVSRPEETTYKFIIDHTGLAPSHEGPLGDFFIFLTNKNLKRQFTVIKTGLLSASVVTAGPIFDFETGDVIDISKYVPLCVVGADLSSGWILKNSSFNLRKIKYKLEKIGNSSSFSVTFSILVIRLV